MARLRRAIRSSESAREWAERSCQHPEALRLRAAQQLRNGVRPVSGDLWEQENGDDSFTELNRAEPGFNSGWVQIMGPPERIQQFKAIETDMTPNPDPFTATYVGLQQVRWLPTNIADTPAEALSRLFRLPGSFYSAPVRRGGARVP